MSDEEREQARRDELKFIFIREGVSIVAGLVVFWLLTSPTARMWLDRKAWEIRRWQGRDAAREARLIAELHRDISAYEHGQAGI